MREWDFGIGVVVDDEQAGVAGSDETIEGERLRRRIRIVATEEYGFPTVFTERVLYALFSLAQRQYGRPNPIKNPWLPANRRLHVSRAAIARELGNPRPSKADYRFIAEACHAMKNTSYEFQATWWDTRSGRLKKLERSVSLLTEVQFYNESGGAQGELRFDDDGDAKISFVEFGSLLFESLTSGYCIGIDIPYLNAIRSSPLAHRLYGYLTKKDQQPTYSEGIAKLARKLGLAKTARSAIIPALDQALELLKRELPVAGGPARRFVESWSYSESDVLAIRFFRDGSDRAAAEQFRKERERNESEASRAKAFEMLKGKGILSGR